MSLPNNYNSHHGRSLRPSPTNDSHSGQSYPDQGRTTLPPLTIAFPTSDSPGSLLNFTSTTQLNLSSPSPDTVHNNYLYPYQQRSTTPASSQQHYCTWTWPLVNTAPPSSNPRVKTSLPSNKRRLHTLILHTRRLPNSQDSMAARHTALITEFRHPLVQPTHGGTRPRPWMSHEKGGKDRSITRLTLTRRRNTHRMTCAHHMRHIPLHRATRRISPRVNLFPPLRTWQGIIEGLLLQLRWPVSSISSTSPCQ
jgi:hypothetical protein